MLTTILLLWIGDFAEHMNFVESVSAIVLVAALIGTVLSVNEKASEVTKVTRRVTVACALIIVVATILPARDTMRLAAAISAGKTIAESDTGSKAIEAVNALLDKIIRDAKLKPDGKA